MWPGYEMVGFTKTKEFGLKLIHNSNFSLEFWRSASICWYFKQNPVLIGLVLLLGSIK